MKIFIVDTFYGPYLQRLYADGQLVHQPWAQQHKAHFAGGFGTGDAYSHGLGLLGVEAIDIVANSASLQQAWAREHRPELLQLSEQGGQQLLAILEAQIRWWQPTVLYVQDINWLPGAFIKHVKPLVEMVVGQNACPLAAGLDLNQYDLLLTAVPHYVEHFRECGVAAEYLPIGFDERLILHHDTNKTRSEQLTFVGGLGGFHSQGTQLLESIAQEVPLNVWGYGGNSLPLSSCLHQRWKGEAWAEDMYALLANSKVTLNRHIDIAKGYACNMRLYEATGMGACLVTDNKSNLTTLFEPDNEIVTYATVSEAVSKINELIKNPSLAATIAYNGQKKTIKEHTYSGHMHLLLSILRRCIKQLPKKIDGCQNKIHPKLISHLKSNRLLIASTYRCFKQGLAWTEKIKRINGIDFDISFIVDKELKTQASNIWMPINEADLRRLSIACLNIVKPSAIVLFSDYDELGSSLISSIKELSIFNGIVLKYHFVIGSND